MGPGPTEPTRPTRPSWVPHDLYPFEDRWAEIDGNLVHYVDEGDGPRAAAAQRQPQLVLRLAGRDPRAARLDSGASRRTTRASGCRGEATGYDFRPRSHSAVVEALVDRLGLHGIVVFGYAWGGPIGLGLAGRRPELVRGLVIGTPGPGPTTGCGPASSRALMGGPLGPLPVERLDLMLRLYLPSEPQARPPDRRRAGRVRGTVPAPARARSCGSCRGRSSAAGIPARGRGQPPAPRRSAGDHPLAGLRPGVRRPRARSGVAVALSGGRRRWTLEHAGQYIDEDAPEDVVAAISGWWPACRVRRRRASAGGVPGSGTDPIITAVRTSSPPT